MIIDGSCQSSIAGWVARLVPLWQVSISLPSFNRVWLSMCWLLLVSADLLPPILNSAGLRCNAGSHLAVTVRIEMALLEHEARGGPEFAIHLMD